MPMGSLSTGDFGILHDGFVGYQIYKTHRVISRGLEAKLSPFGITPNQWNALNQLDRRGPLSQKQLSEALQKEQATITRSLDTLEKKGLIERNPDPRDRRANVISLTPAAVDLLSRIEPVAEAAAEEVVRGISEEELDSLRTTLEKLRRNIDPSGE